MITSCVNVLHRVLSAAQVGTYCGYSATRIASLLAPGSSLYSLEYNPANASIARQIISHAGLDSTVKVMNGTVGACSQVRGVVGGV